MFVLLSKFLGGILDPLYTGSNKSTEVLLNSLPSLRIISGQVHESRLSDNQTVCQVKHESSTVNDDVRVVDSPVSFFVFVFENFDQVAAFYLRGSGNGRVENVSSMSTVNTPAMIYKRSLIPFSFPAIFKILKVRVKFGVGIDRLGCSEAVEVVAVLVAG